MQGFLLGLASGSTCLAYCAPVLVPFFMGSGKKTKQNWGILLQFMSGRLLGYLLFAILAWSISSLMDGKSALRELLTGLSYVGLAGLMVSTVLGKSWNACVSTPAKMRRWFSHFPEFMPAGLGFLTGLNVCPPFLLAFVNATYNISLLESLFFFCLFFLGTALYFLPVPFIGLFNRKIPLRTIGQMASILVAIYYLFSGITTIVGGIVIL